MIPAQVRYDANLPPGAKLLYAEISSLTDQRGYCFASNKYFAELYGVGIRTVQRYLDALKNAGLIRITDGEGGSDQRKIFAGINPLSAEPATEMSPPHDKNDMGPPSELSRPHDKNVADNLNNKKENKKEEQKPPISPKAKTPMPAELMARVEQYAGADLELRDALLGFAEMREKKKARIDTNRMLSLLLSQLDKLSGGAREKKIAIIDWATLKKWTSFYPLDEDKAAAASPPGRTVEAPPGVAAW